MNEQLSDQGHPPDDSKLPPSTAPDPPSADTVQSDRFGLQFSRVVRVSGLAIAFWQTFFENVDRPGILALAGAMMSGSLVVDEIIKRLGGKGT